MTLIRKNTKRTTLRIMSYEKITGIVKISLDFVNAYNADLDFNTFITSNTCNNVGCNYYTNKH